MTAPCVAGVDGGGTRTRALIVTGDGADAGRAEGPAALVRPGHHRAAAQVVAETVRDAAKAAGAPLPLSVLWAGLAGAGRARVRRDLEARLRDERIARAVRVGTDAEAALHDAFGGGPGVMVVAGTGSVVLATGRDGRRLQVGGWGAVMGDEGGGHHLGVAALRAVARATDGRDPPTALTRAVLGHLGLDSPRELPAWADAATKAAIASLAPLVARAADAGDPAAAMAVRRALDELEDQVSTAIRELFPPGVRAGGRVGPDGPLLPTASPPVALTGGLIGPGGPLRSGAKRAVARAGGRVLRRTVVPERGAARLALALAGRPHPT